jgi:hypothetical protein
MSLFNGITASHFPVKMPLLDIACADFKTGIAMRIVFNEARETRKAVPTG